MEIKKLFEREPVKANETLRRRQAEAYQQQDPATQTRAGEDTVSLSPLSRQLSQLSKILDDDEAARKERVQSIKQEVEAGTYSVDRAAVARSLISYAAESEEV